VSQDNEKTSVPVRLHQENKRQRAAMASRARTALTPDRDIQDVQDGPNQQKRRQQPRDDTEEEPPITWTHRDVSSPTPPQAGWYA
jgi:hypothetical protein